MKDNATPIEKLIEKAEDYGKTTVELVKLTAVDKTSEVVSTLAAKLIVYVVVALFILIASVGLSLWIGDILGKTYYGFFIVAGFYALVGLIINASRATWIKAPIRNSIITEMLKAKTV